MSVSHDWIVRNSPYVSPHNRFKVGTEDINGNFIPYDTRFKFSDPISNLDYYTVTNPAAFNLSNLYLQQNNASLSLEDSRLKIIDPADPGILYSNTATIAVDSDWVGWNDPGIWNSLYEPVTILHIDDNGNGEVLNTTHLYYDPGKNLDVFAADSPRGLSEFALTTVSRSGNPLQLLYLSVLSRVSSTTASTPKSNAAPSYGGGGGGGGGGSYGGSGNAVTPSSPGVPAAPAVAPASVQDSAGTSQPPADNQPQIQGQPVQPTRRPYAPAATSTVLPSRTSSGVNVGGVFVPIPNSSVFSLFIEAAAMISVVIIVVFTTFTRYRRKEKD